MSGRAWIIATLGGLAIVVCLNLGFAWRSDRFGVLRDPGGRQLITSPHHERQAKYLLNYSYVPENFDALIIGNSQTINWDLNALTGYRFYNDSMLDENGTEARMLVEKATEKGHFKVP